MESVDQTAHHLLRALFCPGEEIFVHGNLSEPFPGLMVGGRNATLPSRQQFLCALQHPTLEIEVFIHERLRKPWRRRIHKVPAKIYFPIADGDFLDLAAHRFKKLWL